MNPLRKLSDDELRSRMLALVRAEREHLVEVLKHLSEIDLRDAPAGWAFRSLFEYCILELDYSEAAAYRRIRVCRLARRVESVYARIESGTHSLETLTRLNPLLEAGDVERVLNETAGKGIREVDAYIAAAMPRPDVAQVVRRLPQQPPPAPEAAPAPAGVLEPPASAAAAAAAPPPPPPAAPAKVTPLSAERWHVSLTVGRELVEKLERAAGLLGLPRTKLEPVLDRLVEDFLDAKDPARVVPRRVARRAARKHAKAKGAEPKSKPEPAPKPPETGRQPIPQEVRDEVWLRDGGRCVYVGKAGRRCTATTGLEVDHLLPVAMGGRSDDPASLRLLCRKHNGRAAVELFGPELVGPHRRGAPARNGSAIAEANPPTGPPT